MRPCSCSYSSPESASWRHRTPPCLSTGARLPAAAATQSSSLGLGAGSCWARRDGMPRWDAREEAVQCLALGTDAACSGATRAGMGSLGVLRGDGISRHFHTHLSNPEFLTVRNLTRTAALGLSICHLTKICHLTQFKSSAKPLPDVKF